MLQFPLEHGFQDVVQQKVPGAPLGRETGPIRRPPPQLGASAFHGHTRAVGIDDQRSGEGVLLAVSRPWEVNEPPRDGPPGPSSPATTPSEFSCGPNAHPQTVVAGTP